MKTIAKLSLIALTAVLTLPASADELKLEFRPAPHGGMRSQYRLVSETPTVALYSQGTGVGQTMIVEDKPELKLTFRDTGHGTMIPQYVAVR
jgi:hypothetical protein